MNAEIERVRAAHARRRRATTLEAQASAAERYVVATIDDALTVLDSRGDPEAKPAVPAGRWVEHAKRWSPGDAALVAGELNGGLPWVVFHWTAPVAPVTA